LAKKAFEASISKFKAARHHLEHPVPQSLRSLTRARPPLALSGGLVRPPKLRDLLTVIPVVSDQVEFVKEASRTAGAAAVAEASATTGATGLKPEGGIVFAKVTEAVRTISSGSLPPRA
jgi:hypothetical protein